MSSNATEPPALDAEPAEVDDPPPLRGRLAWLTPKRLAILVISWLIVFSIGSLFIASPFGGEPNAAATPNYWHVMYLHGMLISVVGLLALLTCQVGQISSMHTRVWIAAGVVVATLAAALGGIFDTRVPGAEAAMWTQIVGFFALDEILVVLITGMLLEARRRSAVLRSLPFWVSLAAAASMLAAAVMGHIAGFMLEFGAPGPVGAYVKWIGSDTGTFIGNMTGSHSHDMVVAVMALLVSVAASQFGRAHLGRTSHLAVRAGLSLVAAGIVVTTVMYVAMGFTTWGPPTLFQSASGTNGIAGDDIITGLTVMLGGAVTMIGLAAGRGVLRPLRVAAAWTWVLSFATVVIAGYTIEMNESFFGAGDQKAAGAANDGIFTWLHQDVGLFLMPALVLVLLVVQRYLAPHVRGPIATLSIAGVSITFLGAMIWTFVDPAIHGPGYIVTGVGLLVIGAALLATVVWGSVGATGFTSLIASRRMRSVRAEAPAAPHPV
jgi:hypothetical protein